MVRALTRWSDSVDLVQDDVLLLFTYEVLESHLMRWFLVLVGRRLMHNVHSSEGRDALGCSDLGGGGMSFG